MPAEVTVGAKYTTRNHHAQRIDKVMRSRRDKRLQRQPIKPAAGRAPPKNPG
jgi:hypothetical protein